jgi:hypothetical protein
VPLRMVLEVLLLLLLLVPLVVYCPPITAAAEAAYMLPFVLMGGGGRGGLDCLAPVLVVLVGEAVFASLLVAATSAAPSRLPPYRCSSACAGSMRKLTAPTTHRSSYLIP